MNTDKQILILRTQVVMLELCKWLKDKKNQEFLKWLDDKLNQSIKKPFV